MILATAPSGAAIASLLTGLSSWKAGGSWCFSGDPIPRQQEFRSSLVAARSLEA